MQVGVVIVFNSISTHHALYKIFICHSYRKERAHAKYTVKSNVFFLCNNAIKLTRNLIKKKYKQFLITCPVDDRSDCPCPRISRDFFTCDGKYLLLPPELRRLYFRAQEIRHGWCELLPRGSRAPVLPPPPALINAPLNTTDVLRMEINAVTLGP